MYAKKLIYSDGSEGIGWSTIVNFFIICLPSQRFLPAVASIVMNLHINYLEAGTFLFLL